jgi:hypothetical protein
MSFIMFISSPGLWSSILKWTFQNVSSTDELCIAGHSCRLCRLDDAEGKLCYASGFIADIAR